MMVFFWLEERPELLESFSSPFNEGESVAPTAADEVVVSVVCTGVPLTVWIVVRVFTTGVWVVFELLSVVVWELLSLLLLSVVGPLVVDADVFVGWSAVGLGGSVVEVDESDVDVVVGSAFVVVGLVSLVVDVLSVDSDEDEEVDDVDDVDVVVASVVVGAASLEVATSPPVTATL